MNLYFDLRQVWKEKETPELKKPEQVRARNSSACDVDLLRHGGLAQDVSPLFLQASPGYAVRTDRF